MFIKELCEGNLPKKCLMEEFFWAIFSCPQAGGFGSFFLSTEKNEPAGGKPHKRNRKKGSVIIPTITFYNAFIIIQ